MASPVIPRRRRSIFARVVALLALIAIAIALISIYNAFRNNDDTSSKGDRGNHSSKTSKNSKDKDKKKVDVPKTYIVQDGDNLGLISDKFNVRVPVIEKLNPKIDPQTLNAGETLVLRK